MSARAIDGPQLDDLIAGLRCLGPTPMIFGERAIDIAETLDRNRRRIDDLLRREAVEIDGRLEAAEQAAIAAIRRAVAAEDEVADLRDQLSEFRVELGD